MTPVGTSANLTSRINGMTTHTHTHTQVSLIPPREDQCEWHRMTRMTGPDCVVMCNLINTHTHTHTLPNSNSLRLVIKGQNYHCPLFVEQIRQGKALYEKHHALVRKEIELPTGSGSGKKATNIPQKAATCVLYAERPKDSRLFAKIKNYRQESSETAAKNFSDLLDVCWIEIRKCFRSSVT